MSMTLENMMAGLGGEEVTAEQILMEFMKKKNKDLLTEIPVPLPITVLDASVPLIKEEFGQLEADTLKLLLHWYRINMISHKRKGRIEILETLKAQMASEESKAGGFLEKLLKK